ncbi:hypothetical protein BH11ARM2_BH11ARM2_17260 [soil metagenome]
MPENVSTRRRLLASGAALGLAPLALGRQTQATGGEDFSVRRFGALGNGRDDDAKAFQDAIDAAQKAGGGTVTIPSGRYRLEKGLHAKSGARLALVGEGYASVLLHEPDEPLLSFAETVSCDKALFRDFTIESSGKPKSHSTPVFALDGGMTITTFENLYFDGSKQLFGSGVRTRTVADTSSFINCVFWQMSGVGIEVAKGSEIRILGGRIIGANAQRAGNVGVLLTGNSGGVHIATTDIINNHTGLQIGVPGNPSNREIFITHATFDSSVFGIRQVDDAYTSIAGCWAASSDQAQIALEENAKGALMVIAGGTIFNGGAYGRKGAAHGMVVHAGTFSLSGVEIRNNGGTGLLVGEGVENYTVNGCRFHHNATAAVLRGTGYAFVGNVLHDNEKGFVDRGTQPKELSANVMR